jgi:hypothetical protein
MAFDPHERAQLLVGEALITRLSRQDELWLDGHLADCAACARYEHEIEGVVRGIKAFAFDIDPCASDRAETTITSRFVKPQPKLRCVVAAAVFLVVAAVPLYKNLRDVQRDKADALLMEEVDNRVRRVVPSALEPLLQTPFEEYK